MDRASVNAENIESSIISKNTSSLDQNRIRIRKTQINILCLFGFLQYFSPEKGLPKADICSVFILTFARI